ncbi:xanthine dehydrogenase family protein [uncultured Treponema sp.]|uniref:xanthine dehydrogenase family protein n=1 Tax=uncultured Treponema sp. TaxID=162155 RepID=UPI0025DBB56C|nr:xanthine dehydrogenase family protein [uncultured Treponema sp.]
MAAKRKASDKKKTLFSDEFYSDMTAPDMLHAILIRSPFSDGVISTICFDPKIKVPEDCILITHNDLPQKKWINILGTDIPILCSGKIVFKGEPVAILAGPDKETLLELEKSVQITLDKKDLEEHEEKFADSVKNLSTITEEQKKSLQDLPAFPAPLQHYSESDGKRIIARRKYTVGNPGEIFADEEKAAYIIEGLWKNRIHYRTNKETDGVLCYQKGGNLHIFTPSHWISELRQTVSEVTGFPKEKIIVTRTRISVKTTNSLWINSIFAALTALTALKTGKAVKFSLSRKAHEELIEFPPDITISHKTALDKNGIISAMDISIEFDAGSCNPFASDILDRLAIASTGIYNCRNVKVDAKAYSSSNPPSSLHLSMIDSQAFFAVENQIQKIADITGFSPVDLRQMNKAGGLQKMTKPFSFSFGRSIDAINAVAIRSDFKRKFAVARLAGKNRFENEGKLSYSPPMRGIGLACAYDGSGYLGTNFEKSNISVQISVTEDKKIVVNEYPPSPSIKEIWLKIIMEGLELEKRNIVFTNEASNENEGKKNPPVKIPDTLIGTSSIKTILLKKCVEAIKRKKIDGTAFSVKKSLPVSRKKAWNQEEFTGAPFYNTAFGTCTVELELDTCTFRENLRKICVIIDGGKILSPKAAENSVYRAIQRCLSTLVDEDTLKCPSISVQFTKSEEEPKQIGHLVYSMLPAAYTSALSQALAVTVSEVPLQSDSLFKIMEPHELSNKTIPGDEK